MVLLPHRRYVSSIRAERSSLLMTLFTRSKDSSRGTTSHSSIRPTVVCTIRPSILTLTAAWMSTSPASNAMRTSSGDP